MILPTKQVAILPQAEERELLLRAKQGDRKARDRLAMSQYRLASRYCSKAMATSVTARQIGHDDLLNQAMIGVLKAVDRFDTSTGNRLTTYALWWIRHEVSHMLASQRTMLGGTILRNDASKPHVDDRRKAIRIMPLVDELPHDTEPTPREFAQYRMLYERLAPADDETRSLDLQRLRYEIDRLPLREQRALKLHLTGLTQKEIAVRMRMSRENVRVLLKNAREYLTKALSDPRRPR